MSFSIFVSCFSKGEQRNFPRQIVENAFAPYLKRREKEALVLGFQDGSQPTVYIDDTPQISGFSVNRPSWCPEFWGAIVSILAESNSVLYWLGAGSVITNPSVRDDIPQDWRDASLGEPVVTDNIDEILACIEKTA